MPNCSDCEDLPEPLPDRASLYISTPLDHTTGTLIEIFQEEDLEFLRRDDEEILEVKLSDGDYESLAKRLDENLGSEERQQTRCVLLKQDREPSLRDFTNMSPLNRLIGRFQGTWLVDLLRERKFTSYFHPIVKANDPGRVYGYEALLRGKGPGDSVIAPNKIFPTAEKMNLLFNLDREARIFAIEEAAQHGIDERIFINFNPASIYDPAYCLRTTFEAIEEYGIDPDKIVFEVVESEEVHNRAELVGILDHYRENGFNVALDDVGEGYSSLGMLNQLKPDFLKIDMGLVQGISEDSFKASITQNLIDLA
ncbi:MAG: EAL domain-containing protein, partial [bacterium]